MKLTQTDELGALLAVLKVRHCPFKPQVFMWLVSFLFTPQT